MNWNQNEPGKRPTNSGLSVPDKLSRRITDGLPMRLQKRYTQVKTIASNISEHSNFDGAVNRLLKEDWELKEIRIVDKDNVFAILNKEFTEEI